MPNSGTLGSADVACQAVNQVVLLQLVFNNLKQSGLIFNCRFVAPNEGQSKRCHYGTYVPMLVFD